MVIEINVPSEEFDKGKESLENFESSGDNKTKE